jgi:hypothetical protein
MFARVATFEGDPSEADRAIEFVREQQKGSPPPGLENAKGMLMLVDVSVDFYEVPVQRLP